MTRVLAWLEEVYTGADTVEPSSRFTSLAHLPGAAEITKEDFAYYASLVRSLLSICNGEICQHKRCNPSAAKEIVLSACRGTWYAKAADVH